MFLYQASLKLCRLLHLEMLLYLSRCDQTPVKEPGRWRKSFPLADGELEWRVRRLFSGVTWRQWRSTFGTWAGGPTWWPWTRRWCSGRSRTWSAKSGGSASCSGSGAWAAACCGSRPSWPRGERSAWSGPSASSCCTLWTSAPPSPRCASSTPSEGKTQRAVVLPVFAHDVAPEFILSGSEPNIKTMHDLFLKTTPVNLIVVLEEKSGEHDRDEGSSCEDRECHNNISFQCIQYLFGCFIVDQRGGLSTNKLTGPYWSSATKTHALLFLGVPSFGFFSVM